MSVPYEIHAETHELWYWPIPADLLIEDDIGQAVFVETGDDPMIRYSGTLLEHSKSRAAVRLAIGRAGGGQVHVMYVGLEHRVCRMIDLNDPNRPKVGWIRR